MRAALTATVLLLGIASCGGGQRPFRLVQVCLTSVQDISAFKSEMQSLAQTNGLSFVDRSAGAQAEAEAIQRHIRESKLTDPMVMVSGRRKDGVSFSATNFADAPTQMVIGFQLGRGEAGRGFSQVVWQALAKRWIVREGPDPQTSGAFPLPECMATAVEKKVGS